MNKRTLLAPLAALFLSAALLAGCVAASVNGGFTLAEGTIVDSDGSTVAVKMSSATDGSEWTVSTDSSTLTQSGDKFEKNQGESEGVRVVSFTAQNSGNQIITATDGNVTITVEVTIKDGKVTALKGSDTEGYVGEVK